MDQWFGMFKEFITPENLAGFVRAVILLIAGLLIARGLSRLAQRVAEGRLDAQRALVFRRAVYYPVLVLFVAAALHQVGFNLSVLFGAAGVLSVAIGFASQTSASNLVSGLFLIGERPFAIGDVIQVEGTTGEVLSIDSLSVKLRTFDNLFVRIPNETLIKTEVRTLTRFPIRRADLSIGVAYKEDLERVRELLFELALRNPLCLDEPRPVFIFRGFGDSALEMQFSVWALQPSWLEMKNELQLEIKRAFDAEGIEIPFPHLSLYAGSVTDAFPVRVVDAEAALGQAPAR